MMISLAHMLIGTVLTEGYADAGIDAAVQQRLLNPDNLVDRTGKPEDLENAMLWLCPPRQQLGQRAGDQGQRRRQRRPAFWHLSAPAFRPAASRP